MKIATLSYQSVHRKTIDTLCLLKMLGYDDVQVYAKPFSYVKKYKPQICHRPSAENYYELNKVGYYNLVENLGYKITNIDDYLEINEPESTIFLVCGAGIIPREITKKYKIINSHPGFIPNERGLDALKWAIIEKQPIGVSTHLIGDYVDAGSIIERRQVDVFKNDSFYSLAERVYETEIQMLVSAVKKAEEISFFSDGRDFIVHKRMPNEVEARLFEEFEEYKKQYAIP